MVDMWIDPGEEGQQSILNFQRESAIKPFTKKKAHACKHPNLV